MEIGRSIRLNKPVAIVFLILVSVFLLYLMLSSGKDSNYVDKTIKISQLLSASIYLAEEAGKSVVKIRNGGKESSIGAKMKTDGSTGNKEYVTQGDLMSHFVITSGLRSIWPTLTYKSEEKDTKSLNKDPSKVPRPPLYNSEVSRFLKRDESVDVHDVTVWIDPLDATQEYTEGGAKPELLKYVTVMICVVVKGEPIAGVIHQPFVKGEHGKDGITYWGWINHGVSPNIYKGADMTTSNENIRLISSRSHSGSVKKVANTAFKGFKIQHITAAGSGYKSLQIARNQADLYFHTTRIKKWDTCAGDALVSAMGGVMTTRRSFYITYNTADSPEIQDGLVVARTEDRHKVYLEKLKLK